MRDNCAAIDTVLHKGKAGESYNVGGNNELNNLSLVKMICNIMDDAYPKNAPHEKLIHYVTDRKGHDKRYAINNNKMLTELNWKPKHRFDDALKNTIHQLSR